MIRLLIVLLGLMRCADGEFDLKLCENCQRRENVALNANRTDNNQTSTPGDQFRYAASIYKESYYMIVNEHGVQVGRELNYSIYCSAVIVNADYVLTSFACSVSQFPRFFFPAFHRFSVFLMTSFLSQVA